jgi:hypothetical protein
VGQGEKKPTKKRSKKRMKVIKPVSEGKGLNVTTYLWGLTKNTVDAQVATTVLTMMKNRDIGITKAPDIIKACINLRVSLILGTRGR